MTDSRLVPPLDYLHAASRTSLQSFELARLNHAANLRREIAALVDQWIKEASEATMARWMLDQQEAPQVVQSPAMNELPAVFGPKQHIVPELSEPPAGIAPAPPRCIPYRQSIGGRITRKLAKQKASIQT